MNLTDKQLSAQLIAHINVKLALIGSPPVPIEGDKEFAEIAAAMAYQSREKDRLLGHYLSPTDQRIQSFLYDYLQDAPVTNCRRAHLFWIVPVSRACFRCRWIAMNFPPTSSIPIAPPTVFCTIPKATGARRREFSTVTEGRPADS